MSQLTFPEFEYRRPDLDRLEQAFQSVLTELKAAESLNDAIAAVEQIDSIRASVATAYNIGYIRYSINTRDEFYRGEKDWFDSNLPRTEQWRVDYYRTLLDSPHHEALEQHFGRQLFDSARVSLNTFRPEILEELQEVNKLSSEFTQLRGGAEIELDGNTYNLSSITPLEQVPDREKRKAASTAKWQWFADHREQLENIYAKMVGLRTEMARKLDYENYVGLGYANMNRTDYGPDEVANFRRQIREYIVPIAQKLYERQRERLGVDRLHYYDLSFRFPEGNPTPKGSPDEIRKGLRALRCVPR